MRLKPMQDTDISHDGEFKSMVDSVGTPGNIMTCHDQHS